MYPHNTLRPGSPRISVHVRVGSPGKSPEVLEGLEDGNRMYEKRTSGLELHRIVYSAWTRLRFDDSSSAMCCHVLLNNQSAPVDAAECRHLQGHMEDGSATLKNVRLDHLRSFQAQLYPHMGCVKELSKKHTFDLVSWGSKCVDQS